MMPCGARYEMYFREFVAHDVRDVVLVAGVMRMMRGLSFRTET